MAKVILINGSPKAKGNTFIALSEVQKTLGEEGIETGMVHLSCRKTSKPRFTFPNLSFKFSPLVSLYFNFSIIFAKN